jgi:hypothetical protein
VGTPGAGFHSLCLEMTHVTPAHIPWAKGHPVLKSESRGEITAACHIPGSVSVESTKHGLRIFEEKLCL